MSSATLRFPDGQVSESPGTPYVMRGIELATSLVIGTDPGGPRCARAGSPRTSSRAFSSASCCARCSARRVWSPSPAAGTHPACWRPRRGQRGGTGSPCQSLPPIAFRDAADVDESAWQDTIVRHLELEDWVRVDVTDELDIIGPVAGPLLRRFGPLWPPNSHFGGLLAPHARGGTFITGVGGDELLEPAGHHAARLLSGRVRPRGRSSRPGGRDRAQGGARLRGDGGTSNPCRG